METLYDVCFAGQLHEGYELGDVRQNLQKLFKANPETLDKLFSGKTQLLKRGCDKATALKYKQAMERAGARAIIRRVAADATSAAETASPDIDSGASGNPVSAASSTGTDQGSREGLVLAPVGADVLKPSERAEEVRSQIDTSAITLADVGATLGEAAPSPGPAPDASHLSIAEAGEPIPTLTDDRPPLDPNTDGIELAPEGTDFTDCAPAVELAPELDLAGIELAPAGADVLEEQYKTRHESRAPDTSHIALVN